MVDPEQAWRTILETLRPLPSAPRRYAGCLGYRLAEPVLADRDIPAADRSAMDGYAVRAADIVTAPAALQVIGEIPAGSPARPRLGAGECVRIFTGANVPPDADTVVMVEDTETAGDDRVTIRAAAAPGRNILRRGENARQGDVLLAGGALLDATALAVCAAVGCVTPRVHAKPRVAVITTGSELKPPEAPVEPFEIRDSNGPMLCAAVAENGFACLDAVRVTDERAQLLSELRQALAANDIVLITGGVSVGKYDLVPAIVAEAGGETRYHGVAMKPGKPQLFATAAGNRGIFGLPGNPLSVLTGFHEFVLPALRYLAGCPAGACLRQWRLPLRAEVTVKAGRQRHYVPARLVSHESGSAVEPIPNAGSADLVAGSRADGMILVPPGQGRLAAGTCVDFRPWRVA